MTFATPQSLEAIASLSTTDLEQVSGALGSAASFIMMHESGGSATAGHLHSVGRGDGTRGNQYAAASHYVRDRYGSWDGAQSFWKQHHWY